MDQPLRILMLEDSEDDADLFLLELRRGGYNVESRRVETKADFVAALKDPWDVIITDYVLPRFSGIEAIELIRKTDQDIPLIMVSGQVGEDVAVSVIKAGANDYLLKGRYSRLLTTIDRELREAENKRERRKAENELAEMYLTLEKRVLERTAELNRAKEELEISLKEKEVLLKEVHHRVKNNLQVISSLLRMQLAEEPDKKLTQILQASQMRVRSMALAHDLLYRSTRLTALSIKDYLTRLSEYLFELYENPDRKIHRLLDVDEVSFPLETSIPIGMIVAELVTNALKYAFAERPEGQISIAFKKTGEKAYLLRVQDNGVGMKAPDDPTRSSLGLRIVEALSTQLDGTLQRKTTPDGTIFELQIDQNL